MKKAEALEEQAARLATPRLAMDGITKSFGPAKVLNAVDMVVAPGEIHGLIGQNGAGKSTLMKVLGGVLPDHEGTIKVDGAEAALSSPRQALNRGIGMIYQELSLIPSLTVAENIMLGIEPGTIRYSPRDVVNLAAEVVNRSPLLESLPLNRRANELGAGQQQMVEIAKAMARDARVLVLDEPTARLSGPERAGLHALMRELADAGTAMIYVSHFLEEIIANTDRLTVLRNGCVVAQGATAEVDEARLVREMLSRELLAEETTRRTSTKRSQSALRLEAFCVGDAVREVSLDVHQGEIVVITGLVGSGRSRLVSSVAGAGPHTAGKIRVNGRAVKFRTPRAASRAGLMFVAEDRKENGIIGSSTASDNLVLRALDSKIGRAGFVRRRTVEAVARQEFERLDVQPRRPDLEAINFSGGNQQKILIGRALLAKPTVLIIDQPTAGVDVGAKEQIHRLLRNAAAEGAALLIVTDDMDEVIALADKVLVMKRGRITAELHGNEFDRDNLVELVSA
jgi:ABC-type sugar transport system ATPase subunit